VELHNKTCKALLIFQGITEGPITMAPREKVAQELRQDQFLRAQTELMALSLLPIKFKAQFINKKALRH
jgi:hypothetical protein